MRGDAEEAGVPAQSARGARRGLGRKLTALLGVCVAVAVGLNTLVSIWQEAEQFADSRRETLNATAQIFAAAVSEPVARRSAPDALAALRAIARIPAVAYAGVEAADGAPLAELGGAVRLDGDVVLGAATPAGPAIRLLWSRTIAVVVPVLHGGQTVGRLVLVSDASGLVGVLGRRLVTAAAAGGAALVVGWLVALRLRRSITGPVASLIAATRDIAGSHDYRRSIPDGGDDEIGLLVDDFNAMIREIRVRDARLAAHRSDLEREVAERTVDLRAAKEAAEAANAAKSDFLATMTHEIRTPLNGMLVMADLLSHSELAPAQRRYASVVASSGKSLVAIIDDILDLAKVEAGKLTLETLPVDPAEIVDRIALLFSERALGKGLDFAVFVDRFVPSRIDADPVRLGQVVSNLVANALKFTERGAVSIALRRSAAIPGELRIEVADTGIGIPADKLASVFEAFTQADATTTRRFGGTGLGLTISRRIALAMNGRIEVASQEGRGATFTLVVPVDADAPARAPAPAPVAGRVALAVGGDASRRAIAERLQELGMDIEGIGAADLTLLIADRDRLDHDADLRDCAADRVVALAAMGVGAGASSARRIDATLRLPLLAADLDRLMAALASGEPLSGAVEADDARAEALPVWRGKRVLVVDDNAVNREVAIEALSRFACTVETASNGLDAVSRTKTNRYDLILMDVSMPVMDGYEATRRIRAAEKAAGRDAVPIVALTAYAMGKDAMLWREAGMNGALGKPFTLGALAACLAGSLGSPAPPEADRDPDRGRPAARIRSGTGTVADCPADRRPAAAADRRPAAGQLLDAEVAARWRGFIDSGRATFVERVLGLYRRLAPACVAEMRTAAAAGDPGVVRERAHALRSMSLTIGASAVVAMAAAFEERAGEGQVPPAETIERLAGLVDNTLAALETLTGPRDSAAPDDVRSA